MSSCQNKWFLVKGNDFMWKEIISSQRKWITVKGNDFQLGVRNWNCYFRRFRYYKMLWIGMIQRGMVWLEKTCNSANHAQAKYFVSSLCSHEVKTFIPPCQGVYLRLAYSTTVQQYNWPVCQIYSQETNAKGGGGEYFIQLGHWHSRWLWIWQSSRALSERNPKSNETPRVF